MSDVEKLWKESIASQFGGSSEIWLKQGRLDPTFRAIAEKKLPAAKLALLVRHLKENYPVVKASEEDCLLLLEHYSDDAKLKSLFPRLLGSPDPGFREVLVGISSDRDWRELNGAVSALLGDVNTSRMAAHSITNQVWMTGSLDERLAIRKHLGEGEVRSVDAEDLIRKTPPAEYLTRLTPYLGELGKAYTRALTALVAVDHSSRKEAVRALLAELSKSESAPAATFWLLVHLEPEDWDRHADRVRAVLRQATGYLLDLTEDQFKRFFGSLREHKLVGFKEEVSLLLEGLPWLQREVLETLRAFDARESSSAVSRLAKSKRTDPAVAALAKEVLAGWGAKKKAPKKVDATTRDGALALLEAEGLGALKRAIEPLLRPSIRLTAAKKKAGSWWGGLPHLPKGVAWPEFEGVPMTFLAQLDLEELAPFDADGRLPSTGLLLFFCDEAHDFEPIDGAHRVLHVASAKKLAAAKAPGKTKPRKEVGIAFAKELSFPSPLLLARKAKAFAGPNERRRYEQFLSGVAPAPPGGTHRVLGLPDAVQDEVIDNVEREVLLLQVDSEKKLGMMWGDTGRLYFVIGKTDLEKRDFSKTRLELQAS